MTVHFPGYVAGDYELRKDELILTIRTTDGAKLTYQAAYDAARAMLEDCFETIEAPVPPVTEQEIAEDPSLN